MPEHRPSDPVAAAVAVFRLSILALVGAGFAYLLAGSFGGGARSAPWVIGYHLQGTPVSVQLGSSCDTKSGIRSDEGAATCQRVRWTVNGRTHTGHLLANTTDIHGAGTKRLSFTGQARALEDTAYGKPGPATTITVITAAALLALSTLGFLTSALLRLRAAPTRTRTSHRTSRRPQPTRRPVHVTPTHLGHVQPTWQQPVPAPWRQSALTPSTWQQPAPGQPAPGQPAPGQPTPGQPTPAPAQPSPTQPVPAPAPTRPAPARPAPAQPAPAPSTWQHPAPAQPAPEWTAPIRTAPVQEAWEQPVWSQPPPAEPAWSHPAARQAAQPVAHQ